MSLDDEIMCIKILEALGIDPTKIVCFTISFKVSRKPKIYIERILTNEELSAVAHIAEQYEVHPIAKGG